ncbi:hypothetical protein BAY60_33365 [Prauserella muralis]|uniref:SAV-6107-like HEPN domain-containing protein n=1 Tax=Prauserella muralis TaxID=588067 RepID=A0A2V4AIL0_9PSEU|nr:hypothetical protein BAY60_33365 [Prauserella muralis]
MPIELRPPAAPAAVSLLTHARHGIAEAGTETDPVARFTASYLSALRAAAAILAARGRPHRGRARPESVWTLLGAAAPELEQWAAFFAAHSARQAEAQAGITRRITGTAADDLFRNAGQFVSLAQRVVHGSPPERVAQCGARPQVRSRSR